MALTTGKAYKGWEEEWGNLTGTTGAAYTTDGSTDVTWACGKLGKRSVIVRNSGATNTIYYRIRGRVYPAGQLMDIKAETSLATETTAIEKINDYYHQIVIDVKNNAGASTFIIEYGGRYLA